MINRKLIRPNLAELKDRQAQLRSPQTASHSPVHRELPPRDLDPSGPSPAAAGGSPMRRRQAPPDATSAEAFYYLKQMNNKTPMVVILDGSEELRGHIEWYDRACIKVNREAAPNLLVYKHAVRYMYKQEEENRLSDDDV